MDKCNCEFYWKEVSKFSSCCTFHSKTFDTISKCPMFSTSKEIKVNNNISNGSQFKKNTHSKAFTSNSQAITSNSQGVLIKRKYNRKVTDSIYERFHNYGVKFEAEIQWDHLFKYEEIKLNNNVSYKRIDLDNCLIKVFKKSILVTLRSKKDIIGLEVKSAESKAKSIINDVLDKLPQAIKVNNRDVVNTHNAFVNDPIAKSSEQPIKVMIDNELRCISDKSKGRNELEFVSKNWAIQDSTEYELDVKALIDKGLSRDFIANALNELIKDRYFHAENMRSHVEAIQSLSEGVKELREEVKNISTHSHNKEDSLDHSPLSESSFNIQRTFSKYDLEKKEKIKQFINEFK